jgi:type III secretion protein S
MQSNLDLIVAKVQNALLIVLIVSAPVLIAAMLIGLVVGLLQALTQIQDQTLPQGAKLLVVLIIIILFGPLLSQQIANQASLALDDFPALTR